jgi:hypothetical protein
MNMSKDMQKIKAIIDRLPDDKKPVGNSLFKELLFMSRTLDKLKQQITQEGPVSMFHQGKQEFLREHPAEVAYVKISQRYGQYFKQLASLLPDDDGKDKKDELLEFVKTK